MPRVGVFNGDLVVDTPTDLTGPILLKTDDNRFSLKGVAFREGPFTQKLKLRFVGGAGGLDTLVPPKAFDGYTVRSILIDTLAACGETLAATADKNLLNIFLTKWVRLAQTGKDVVKSLLELNNGASWRIIPDGTFFATMNEPWPSVSDDQFDLATWNRSEGWAVIGSQQPFALPGQTITITDGTDFQSTQEISYLIHSIEADKVRTHLYFEDV